MAGEKSVRLFLLGDNRDVKTKLEEVDASVDELKAKHPELTFGIETAGAQEKLKLLRDEVKRTTNDVKTLKKNLAEVDFAKLGMGAAWFTGLAAAAGPGVAIVGTLSAGLLGIAGAGVSAGIGLGVFAAIAKSAYASVSTAVAQYGVAMSTSGAARATAMKSYQQELAALTPAQRAFAASIIQVKSEWDSFVQHNLSGVSAIMSQGIGLIGPLLRDAQPFLSGTEKALSGIFSALSRGEKSDRFKLFIQEMSDGAGDALTSLAGIFGHLGSMIGKTLEDFMPLGQVMLEDIDKILGKADKGTDGFIQKFFNWLQTNGPAAMNILKNIGTTLLNMGKAFGGMGHLNIGAFLAISNVIATISKNPIGAGALVGLLALTKIAQMAMPMIKLALAFKELAEAEMLAEIGAIALDSVPIILVIAGLIALIILLVMHWKTVAKVAVEVWHAIWSAGKTAFDWIKNNWPLILAILTGPIGLAVLEIVRHWHDITAGFDAVINWVKTHWKDILGWLVDPIGMAVNTIKTHTHAISNAFDVMRHGVASILAGARHDLLSSFDETRHDIAAFAMWVPKEIVHLWDTVRHDTAAAVDWIRHTAASAWTAMINDIHNFIYGKVFPAFRALPGQIVGFLSSLPGRMVSIGKNVIDGLINGIKSAAADIPGIMKSLASDVASYFTNPLKIFSPSRLFFSHGVNIVRGAELGVEAQSPSLLGKMRALGQQVGNMGLGLTASGKIAGAVSAGNGALQVEWIGGQGADQGFIEWLKENIRFRNGDPSVLGR